MFNANVWVSALQLVQDTSIAYITTKKINDAIRTVHGAAISMASESTLCTKGRTHSWPIRHLLQGRCFNNFQQMYTNILYKCFFYTNVQNGQQRVAELTRLSISLGKSLECRSHAKLSIGQWIVDQDAHPNTIRIAVICSIQPGYAWLI